MSLLHMDVIKMKKTEGPKEHFWIILLVSEK